jgi:hypothetical protein
MLYVRVGYKRPPLLLPHVRTTTTDPPLPPLRARTPASSRRRPTPSRPSLGPTRAPMVACWTSPPGASPETDHPRVRRRDLAAAARRSHLRSRRHHQSAPGEANRTVVSLVFLPRPCLTGDKLPSAVKGTVVNIQGQICKPGTCLQEKLSLFYSSWVQCLRKCLEIHREFRKMQTHFLISVMVDLQLLQSMIIVFTCIFWMKIQIQFDTFLL